jgi:hypothetical protein
MSMIKLLEVPMKDWILFAFFVTCIVLAFFFSFNPISF